MLPLIAVTLTAVFGPTEDQAKTRLLNVAWQFGYSVKEVRSIRNLAMENKAWFPKRCNTHGVCPSFAWTQDSDWCYACWNTLDNVMMELNPDIRFPSYDTARTNLRELHRLLGDEMWYARRMPPPTPEWHFTDRVPEGVYPKSQR